MFKGRRPPQLRMSIRKIKKAVMIMADWLEWITRTLYARTDAFTAYVRDKYASCESVVDETSALGLPTMHDCPPQWKRYCEQWSHRRNCQSTVACVVGCEREVGAHFKVNNESSWPFSSTPLNYVLHSSIHACWLRLLVHNVKHH